MSDIFSSLLSGSKRSVPYMIEGITHICRSLAPRAPGSEGERKAAEYMAGILEKDCGCEAAKIETFKEHPTAFYSYFYFSMVFDCLCAISYFLSPLLSILFGGLALLLFLLQFVLYKQVIDPLFPEKESVNVTAIRPCSGVVNQRVFLNGHIDAAWEFPLNYRFGGVVFEIPGVLALIGVCFYMGVSVCAVCGAGEWVRSAGLYGLIFVPFFVLVAFTYDPKHIVDGANDNLSGCFMGIALMHEMERLGITLEHTEVGVILTGSEEAGLRGAKAWSKVHKDDYRDAPTFIISYDTIHDPRYLMVNARDLNGTVSSDKTLCKTFLCAASASGVPCRMGQVPLFGGATDSAAFTQGGFRSIGVTGLNHKLEDYYHTRRDSYDHLNAEGLENCYKATVEMLRLLDQGTEAL